MPSLRNLDPLNSFLIITIYGFYDELQIFTCNIPIHNIVAYKLQHFGIDSFEDHKMT